MEAKAGLKLGIMREIMDPVFNNRLGFRVSLDERHGSHRFFLYLIQNYIHAMF